MTKLCKDCKFCSYKEPSVIKKLLPFLIMPNDWLEHARCLHKSATTKKQSRDDLVTGEPVKINIHDYSYCATMRSLNYDTYCSEDGKFWEPK